jgi:adenylate cyclase
MAIDPEEPVALYNSACAFCLAGEFEQSLDILEKAVRVGNPHRYWIEYDSDLDPLRDHPRFKALLEQFDQAI